MKETIGLLLNIVKDLLPSLAAFFAGRQSKEIEVLEDENEMLKRFKDIDGVSVDDDDIYDAGMWNGGDRGRVPKTKPTDTESAKQDRIS